MSLGMIYLIGLVVTWIGAVAYAYFLNEEKIKGKCKRFNKTSDDYEHSVEHYFIATLYGVIWPTSVPITAIILVGLVLGKEIVKYFDKKEIK
jgi:uncharacterized membrane protein